MHREGSDPRILITIHITDISRPLITYYDIKKIDSNSSIIGYIGYPHYRFRSLALMQQHGWTTLPKDQQATILFRDQVEQVLNNKQRSRKSRQRRREKRAHYRRQNAEQQGDY